LVDEVAGYREERRVVAEHVHDAVDVDGVRRQHLAGAARVAQQVCDYIVVLEVREAPYLRPTGMHPDAVGRGRHRAAGAGASSACTARAARAATGNGPVLAGDAGAATRQRNATEQRACDPTP